jgi:hypothetical protein
MIAALLRQQALPAAFRATWQQAVDEPLLWLPDIAAGAASLAETGDDACWASLATTFSVVHFTLT